MPVGFLVGPACSPCLVYHGSSIHLPFMNLFTFRVSFFTVVPFSMCRNLSYQLLHLAWPGPYSSPCWGVPMRTDVPLLSLLPRTPREHPAGVPSSALKNSLDYPRIGQNYSRETLSSSLSLLCSSLGSIQKSTVLFPTLQQTVCARVYNCLWSSPAFLGRCHVSPTQEHNSHSSGRVIGALERDL